MTLNRYYLLTTFLAFVILSIGIFGYSTFIHAKQSKKDAIKMVDAVSVQTFSSMYQIMSRGWDRSDLQKYMGSLRDSFKNSSIEVSIYRGSDVQKLFGEIEQKEADTAVKETFEKAKKQVIDQDGELRYIMPLLTESECIKCHINSKIGSVLGIIEVRYGYSKIIEEARWEFLQFLAFALPFIFFAMALFSHLTVSKIKNGVAILRNKVHSINNVRDLKKLEIEDVKMPFAELNELLFQTDEMIKKLKSVAVDKDILEFEIRLLDRLVISSDIVKDWKEYVKNLLIDINKVMDAYALFTVFRVGDDSFEVEIFWRAHPKDDVQKHLENVVKELYINRLNIIEEQTLFISHNYSSENSCLSEVGVDDIDAHCKSLFLDSPKIGGVVGIGVQSELSSDPIRSIVIDSILSTLLNIVGSVKAIHKYTQDLEYYATRDPLSGLFNQRVFRDLLENECMRAQRHNHKFAVMVIDCDNFKPINDKFGHAFGDRFLQEFGRVLEKQKRKEDILSRYGGDEFAMILPETNENEAATVAKRILDAVEQFKLPAPDGTSISVTVSIGVSIFPEHAQEPHEMFMVADYMMYESKQKGKNSLSIPTMEELEEYHKSHENKTLFVMNALKEKRVLPFFQPILNLSSGEVEIHELLMRIEMDDEIIRAQEFIEIAENIGIVHQMDYIVIEKALKHTLESGYKGKLFVNLSPRSLVIGEFIENIKRICLEYGVQKENIVFEITERETVKSFSLLEKFVQNLKLEGFSFAIDDFGSGFSSFHYIKKFPIDYLKIDGEFILNIAKDKKDLAFVQSIIKLAKELEIKTVAEFVEDGETLRVIKELGVDFAQGYFIGKPKGEFVK